MKETLSSMIARKKRVEQHAVDLLLACQSVLNACENANFIRMDQALRMCRDAVEGATGEKQTYPKGKCFGRYEVGFAPAISEEPSVVPESTSPAEPPSCPRWRRAIGD